MAFTTGETKALGQWSYTVLVEFVDLPVEKEAAYWAAIQYFADVMFQEMLTAPVDELETVNTR